MGEGGIGGQQQEDFQHRFHNFHYLSCDCGNLGVAPNLSRLRRDPVRSKIVQAPPIAIGIFFPVGKVLLFWVQEEQDAVQIPSLCYLGLYDGVYFSNFSIGVTPPIPIFAACFLNFLNASEHYLVSYCRIF